MMDPLPVLNLPPLPAVLDVDGTLSLYHPELPHSPAPNGWHLARCLKIGAAGDELEIELLPCRKLDFASRVRASWQL
jgi:hypothetical protein